MLIFGAFFKHLDFRAKMIDSNVDIWIFAPKLIDSKADFWRKNSNTVALKLNLKQDFSSDFPTILWQNMLGHPVQVTLQDIAEN